MKTLVLICLASVSLISCKKKVCYDCFWEREYIQYGNKTNDTEVETICDKTEKQMGEYNKTGRQENRDGTLHTLTGCYEHH